MAITRCPYCHAIIDEADKYCNNCGTQLLFTEDEEIEEEIPGEKIIDAEVEEKDYTVEEPEGEKRPAAAKDLDAEIDEELEREVREKTEELALDELIAEEEDKALGEDVTEEVILVDEIAASEAKGTGGSRELGDETPAAEKPEAETEGEEEEEEEDDGEEEDEDKEDDDEEDKKEDEDDEDEEEDREEKDEEDEDEEDAEDAEDDEEVDEDEDKDEDEKNGDEEADEDVEIDEEDLGEKTAREGTTEIPEPLGASEADVEVEYVSEPPDADFASTAGESALKPPTFDTGELEGLGRTVELAKEKVDRFVEAGFAAVPPDLAVASGPEVPAAPSEAGPKPPAGEPSTGTLPPWARSMQGAPAFPADTGPVETRKVLGGGPDDGEAEEEVEIFPRRRLSDSTMGLPERIAQSPLPFDRTPDEDEEEDAAGPETGREDEEPEGVEAPAAAARPAREPILPPRGHAVSPEAERGIEPIDESEEAEPRPPFSFAVFFKSKAFDVLFVGLFWLVALGLAASSMDMTLFEILGAMSGPMLLLYAVLVALYFFLFKFFLGETLGDRLFRPRE